MATNLAAMYYAGNFYSHYVDGQDTGHFTSITFYTH